jgi:hypothetical protein
MSGGGWTEWKKKLIWTSLAESSPGRQSWVNKDRTRMPLAIIQSQPGSL